MEEKYGTPKAKLQWMVNKFKTTNADKNQDGKIDLQEWNDFFDKEFYQPFDPKSNINAVATVLGGAPEDWTCTPPTLFIPTITFLQVVFFLLS